jgi:nucleoside-triphosphatase THEP1
LTDLEFSKRHVFLTRCAWSGISQRSGISLDTGRLRGCYKCLCSKRPIGFCTLQVVVSLTKVRYLYSSLATLAPIIGDFVKKFDLETLDSNPQYSHMNIFLLFRIDQDNNGSSKSQLDDTTFEILWQKMSQPLVKLGIPQQDIDKLKEAPLSFDEESSIKILEEWNELEDDILSKVKDAEERILIIQGLFEIHELAMFDFDGMIYGLHRKFQDGTREWFFDKLSNWFDDEKSRVMTLTAGPGIGKSVLSAKVCELYKQRGQLAGCHFCDFRNADARNPHKIIESLASQFCDNVDGFLDKLTYFLDREHSRDSLLDAFRVLLNDPLHALDRREPMLIVVDALDKSVTDVKSEFLELISEKFPKLPKWIKMLITSRPELQLLKKLQHLNPLEISLDDHNHKGNVKFAYFEV